MRTRVVLAALAALTVAATASGAARVVGGQTIQVQSAPWTVYVQQTVGRSIFLCTGSVVDASHVLTAAHCLFDDNGVQAPPSALQVRAGVSNYSQPLSTDAEQDRGVSSFRIHPGFTWTGHSAPDDVAVLALVSPLDLSGPAVQAVTLPTAGMAFPAGATVSIAGFGRQSPTASSSGQLASLTATVDPAGTCGKDQLLDDNAVYLCAASSTSAACNGDSGSGLVTTGGTPVLIGVENAGDDGCPTGSHSLYAYTGAPEILQFIQGNDHPPTAVRNDASTYPQLGWDSPKPVAGDTFDCEPGDWKTPGVQIAYSFVDDTTGNVLQSGNSSSFLVPVADVGAEVYCQIAVTNSGGTELARTEPADPVGPLPNVRILRVGPVAGSRGQGVSVLVTLLAAAGLHGKFAVCVAPSKLVAGRVCHSVANDDGAAGRLPFLFKFRIKPTAPRGTSPVAITAVAGLASAKAATTLRVS